MSTTDNTRGTPEYSIPYCSGTKLSPAIVPTRIHNNEIENIKRS